MGACITANRQGIGKEIISASIVERPVRVVVPITINAAANIGNAIGTRALSALKKAVRPGLRSNIAIEIRSPTSARDNPKVTIFHKDTVGRY